MTHRTPHTVILIEAARTRRRRFTPSTVACSTLRNHVDWEIALGLVSVAGGADQRPRCGPAPSPDRNDRDK